MMTFESANDNFQFPGFGSLTPTAERKNNKRDLSFVAENVSSSCCLEEELQSSDKGVHDDEINEELNTDFRVGNRC